MIGALEGIPIVTGVSSVVVMVGGVGYQVAVTQTTQGSFRPNEKVFLYIYTSVKQDSLDLFGFKSKKELTMFKLLLGVSGVGPKTALGIIDFGVNGIANAISNADTSFFTQIPKVGKKMAQKIIIDLKNKVGSVSELDLSDGETGDMQDLIQTLINMGYAHREAREMVRMVPGEIATIEEKIMFILKKSGK